jgi:hypothetical protein
MGVDDEQDVGAGWRYGRKTGRRILSFRLSVSFTRGQEGAMLPQSGSMRELLEHCRSSFMISHEPVFCDHVLFQCSPTSNSHKNVWVQCILYAATRLLDIWLIAISG